MSRHRKNEQLPQYFTSWASYQIPLRLTGPIDYEQTEFLNAYYVAYYDEENRLANVTKYLIERQKLGAREVKTFKQQERASDEALLLSVIFDTVDNLGEEIPKEKLTPGTSLYFDEIYPLGKIRPRLLTGNLISYSDTREREVYFKGAVDEAGKMIHLEKVERKFFFKEEYRYWSNGKLQERIATKEDGTIRHYYFDRKGKELEEQFEEVTNTNLVSEEEGAIHYR